MNWERALFLHTGWTAYYDGSEAPEGGHAYLKNSVGVEAENFKEVGGWCYGYAPVSRTREGRRFRGIPEAYRTVNIDKLGAASQQQEVEGITVIWTARKPNEGPVIIGIYDDASVFRFMPELTDIARPYIAKARAESCHLIPVKDRSFNVTHKQKGFPGMAAAWFPGRHVNGAAHAMLDAVASYIPVVRRYAHTGDLA